MTNQTLTMVALLLVLLNFPAASAAQLLATTPTADQTVQPPPGAPSVGAQANRPTLRQRDGRYRLHSGDSLELIFPFTPEFNQTVTVLPDGYISPRGLEGLHVEGLAISEVTQALKKGYATILHEPVITVELKDFERPYFIAGGEVSKPGKYDLRQDVTLIQAVAIAGGFNENSKHSEVLLFRKVSDTMFEVKKINVKKMLQAATLNEDPHLQPGDMFFVPQNSFSKYKRFLPTSSVGTYFTGLRP